MQDKQCTLQKCDAIGALDLQHAPALEHSPARVRLGLPAVSDDALWRSEHSTCSACGSSYQRWVHLARDRGMHAPVEAPAALASGLSPRCNAACEDTKGCQWGWYRAMSMCQIAARGGADQPQRRARPLVSSAPRLPGERRGDRSDGDRARPACSHRLKSTHRAQGRARPLAPAFAAVAITRMSPRCAGMLLLYEEGFFHFSPGKKNTALLSWGPPQPTMWEASSDGRALA